MSLLSDKEQIAQQENKVISVHIAGAEEFTAAYNKLNFPFNQGLKKGQRAQI